MKIVHISTYDTLGGAARAAYRLNKGLRQAGEDSRMLVRHRHSEDPFAFMAVPAHFKKDDEQSFFCQAAIQEQAVNANRTELSNTLFSISYPGYDLSAAPIVREADIINLHWVTYYQSPVTIKSLVDLGKPIVWTLHDQWAFTGGCHYSAGCRGYEKGCENCPQLRDDPFNLTGALLADKKELFAGDNLTIVTPSRWLAECARASHVFRGKRIEVIPNGIETDRFTPVSKSRAKTALGLDPETITLLFGAENTGERRKGFGELAQALRRCLDDKSFKELVESDRLRLLCFGYPAAVIEGAGIPVVSLGYLHSDEKVSLAYSAADVFIHASLDYNLPNTMLEAMSCGTPVVAFDIGGMPDVIQNGVTGLLAPAGDSEKLGNAIVALLSDTTLMDEMGSQSLNKVLSGYKIRDMAEGYLELYADLARLDSVNPRFKPSLDGVTSDRIKGMAALEMTARLETRLGLRFSIFSKEACFDALISFSPIIEKAFRTAEAERIENEQMSKALELHLKSLSEDHAARLNLITGLGRRIEEIEEDRAERLKVAEELGHRIGELEADREERLKLIGELGRRLEEAESDRAARLKLVEDLSLRIEEIEADRAERLKMAEELGHRIGELEADREERLKLIGELGRRLEEAESDRAARLKLVEDLSLRIEEIEADRAERLKVAEELGHRIGELEADREKRLKLIGELGRRLDESEADRAARLALIHQLGHRLDESEKDRADRLEVINKLDSMLKASEHRLQDILHRLPLVTIVTPVFNGAKWIERCIKSVIEQDYPRIEHIIVDGGSSDETLEICSRYPHLVVHSKPDRGQSHAINKGFAMAGGDILAWLCADDEYEPEAVSVAVREILKGDRIVMGKSRFIDAESNVMFDHQANQNSRYDHGMLLRFWRYPTISQPAVFWRRSLWEACGPLRENLYFAMDYDLWLRMTLKTEFRMVSNYLARYRIHPDAKCFSDNYGSKVELIAVSRNYWPGWWHLSYWRLFFGYLLSAHAVTKHFSDGEESLRRSMDHLNNGRRLRSVGAFILTHLRHIPAPRLPGYTLAAKRVFAEAIGPLWLWRFACKTARFDLREKRLSLTGFSSHCEGGDVFLITADGEGYRNPQYRFWGKRGNDFTLLRDWTSDSSIEVKCGAGDWADFGVHVRQGSEGDFLNQAWIQRPVSMENNA